MSTIAVLTSQESGADSLVDINNNFTNLNADKVEVSSLGTVGQVLTSNGVGVNPTFQTPAEDYLLGIKALGSSILFESLLVSGNTATTSVTLSDGTARFQAVYINKASTITGIKWMQGTAGDYTADNNNYVALYSYSAGTLTQVAISANDGNIWKATSQTIGTVAFTTPYAASVGIYFIGFLYNNSSQSTAPALVSGASFSWAAQSSLELTNSASLSASLATQTELTTPIAMSSLTVSTVKHWFALY